MDLETTVRGLAPRLLRYCLGRTGSAEQAEEVAQEALAALVGRWRRHGPPDSPEGFVFAVARRRAVRAGLWRRLLLPLSALGNGHDDAPDPRAPAARDPAVSAGSAGTDPNPLERLDRRRELARVLAALRRLPGRDREALLLAAAGELSTPEAARVLGISTSAFKMRLHRARRRLAALLEDRNDRSPRR
ncbi:MAG: RNA polymerase sigma factor [Thermoanaerobaculia bacterium]